MDPFMDSKQTVDRLPSRRHRLAIAVAAGVLLGTGTLTGCSDQQASTAEKTPLGQQASPGGAWASIDDGEVIARINGSPLYRENLEVVKENLGAEVPEDRLVSRMVELRLLADRAREEGLDRDPATQARIQNAIDNQLANAYLLKYLSETTVSESDIEAAYAQAVDSLGEETQYHARHILVGDEQTARDVIARLDDGADFGALAREYSRDSSSGEAGGDLGWFSLDQMVEPFAEAVGDLEPGQLAQDPVETRFGWHVIRLDETRPMPRPTLEQMRPELEDRARRDAMNEMIAELRDSANVEILTSDVRSMVERDDDAAHGAAGARADDAPGKSASDPVTPTREEDHGEGEADMGNLPAEPLRAMP